MFLSITGPRLLVRSIWKIEKKRLAEASNYEFLKLTVITFESGECIERSIEKLKEKRDKRLTFLSAYKCGHTCRKWRRQCDHQRLVRPEPSRIQS